VNVWYRVADLDAGRAQAVGLDHDVGNIEREHDVRVARALLGEAQLGAARGEPRPPVLVVAEDELESELGHIELAGGV
jgi:hypothetical protein